MKTQDKELVVEKTCSCCKREIYSTYVWEVNEFGTWFNCPACDSTGIIKAVVDNKEAS